MLVTVFSDAGLCPHTSAGSWAGWAKSLRGTARGGGPLKAEVSCSSIAEARAAVNAVQMALNQGVLQPGDEVLIQTDNTGVQGVLAGNPPSKTKKQTAERQLIADAFKKICATHQLTSRWRHVKGHKGNVTPRNSVNTYCDWVCRFYLALERNRKDPKMYPSPWHHRGPREVPFGLSPSAETLQRLGLAE